MQALVLTDYRRLELKEIELPTLGPTDVLVRVAACGICGSDVHGYDGSSGRREPPIIMGHEAAGEIAEVGPAVDRTQVGDRVTFDSTIYCGQCNPCRRGDVNLCEHRRVLGVSCSDYSKPGAFAEFVAVPQHLLFPLPHELSYEHAALIEPVAIALHAVRRLQAQPGERAVVVGSGMIGLLVIQALRVAGCSEVIAVDLDDRRLALAKELGANVTMKAKQTDVVRAVIDLTHGQGADIAVEAVGNSAALSTVINSIRRGGRAALIGNVSTEVPFPLQTVVTRELSLLGSCASAGEYPRAIELVARGAIQLQPLISAIAPLADGPDYFHRLYTQEPGLMKVILQP